jgi:hypothetical protein
MKIGQPKLSERKSRRSGLVVTPTSAQSDLAFILDDYGKKGSITFRFSGGDTPSAGTGF